VAPKRVWRKRGEVGLILATEDGVYGGVPSLVSVEGIFSGNVLRYRHKTINLFAAFTPLVCLRELHPARNVENQRKLSANIPTRSNSCKAGANCSWLGEWSGGLDPLPATTICLCVFFANLF